MKKKFKAFTLIELLIVIAILAVLVLIAIPKYNNSRVKAEITAHNANVRILETAGIRYLSENKTEEADKTNMIDKLVEKKYIKAKPKLPKSVTGTEYVVKVVDDEIVVEPALIEETK